jgi:DNA (cytosine-5)-methyltransferase 3A
MSCGQLALLRAGIKYDNYFASEIDKHAIVVTQKNFPDTKQLGNVTGIKGSKLPKIDLLIGGSPCQGFSFAGKQLNFNDPRSRLFFEFVRIKGELNPRSFLLENVNMKKEFRDIITGYLGVEPIRINSSEFSAQERDRWYWTNIRVELNQDKNLETIEDILQDEVDIAFRIDPQRSMVICENEIKKNKIRFLGLDSKENRVYQIHGKNITLDNEAELPAKTGLYALPCLTPGRLEKRQNGRRFKPPFSKFYTLTAQDRHGVFTNNFIRSLTPVEYERLQTIPDGYSNCVSDSQRYKMLGNGWTVDVIAHIFKGIQ